MASLLDGLLTGEPNAATHVAGAEGHRQRLRARLLAEPDSVGDQELLELVLFLALPRRDTKPISRAMLARFGSFAAAITAPVQALRSIDGLGEAGAAAVKTVQAAAVRLMGSPG